MSIAIDTEGPQPLYMQLKEAFLEEIGKGRLKPHDRLPSERELSEQLGISRMTVRRALLDLARDGVVYTIMGKGTYVAEPRVEQELLPLRSFTEETQLLGLETFSLILEAEVVLASARVAGMLEVELGDELVKLVRVRHMEEIPAAIQSAYLPHRLCPNLLSHDLVTSSLYDVLRREYELVLWKAKNTVQAALMNDEEMAIFGVSYPAAVLVMEQITYLDNGRPVEYTKTAYRGDKYRFHSMFTSRL